MKKPTPLGETLWRVTWWRRMCGRTRMARTWWASQAWRGRSVALLGEDGGWGVIDHGCP